MAYLKKLWCIRNKNVHGSYQYTTLSSYKKGAKNKFFESPTGASTWKDAKRMGYVVELINVMFDY